MSPQPRRLAVLISGSGTNLQALIDACSSGAIPNTEIILVLSNRKAAYGLTRAAQATPPIPTAYIALQPFIKSKASQGITASREDYDDEVAWRVREANPDLVVLAGWMHVLSERFLDVMGGKKQREGSTGGGEGKPIPVINLHPALPGAFDGANAIGRAWEAHEKGEIEKAGVMVHQVVKEVDRGAPILVREIPFREGETKEEFEKRLHGIEWEVIVEATRKVLDEITS
ncbi:hypothetical protein M422DRAFT_25988 [Sphaerobolus stellatus SS14]|nr:hypothetical protein M422DRAFT_25988 [Sphaerobolus stellatus SS14]